MFSAHEMQTMLCDTVQSHSLYPKTPANQFRRDGVTPFSAHQILCAMLFLHEENLPEKDRAINAKIMLGHELIEDTYAPLPFWVKDQEPEVKESISGMTYLDGQDKFSLIWKKNNRIFLCSFCDIGVNFMVNGGRSPERKAIYEKELPRQADHVDIIYPNLNMTLMFRSLLKRP